MQTFSLSLAGILFVILQIVVTCHIILFKEDVKSAIGWIGLVWFTPVLGTIIYTLFGINRIRRKAFTLRNSGPDIIDVKQVLDKALRKQIPPYLTQLWRMGYKVHPQNFSAGNKIVPLINGDEAYPQMCAAIAAAKKEVLLASYVFDNDRAGKMFAAALKSAASNGARVKVLIDGVGAKSGPRPFIMKEFKQIKGLEYAVFLPVRGSLPFVNLRNHRKILVTDGRTAFFGGMNISEQNLLKLKPKKPVADITFKIEGPVIEQISRLFMQDWSFAAEKNFTPLSFNIKQEEAGNISCRIIPDGPDSDYGKIEFIDVAALNCAQHAVTIVTPYFLPTATITTALESACMRGVNVEIILPRKSNIFGMDYAMAANFNKLTAKGIKIYLTNPPFDHSKFMIADGVWVFAGSSNWDERSFKLNFESNIELLSRELCAELAQTAENKKANAVLFRTKRFSLAKRLRNNAFRLLTPYY